jgi:hypothetical protein
MHEVKEPLGKFGHFYLYIYLYIYINFVNVRVMIAITQFRVTVVKKNSQRLTFRTNEGAVFYLQCILSLVSVLIIFYTDIVRCSIPCIGDG